MMAVTATREAQMFLDHPVSWAARAALGSKRL
jgi:hypothetical protein